MRAIRDAVIGSLASDLPGSVFGSYSATDLTRYAVVFVARSTVERSRYSSAQNRDVFTVTVHSVGVDEDSALWVQERVDRLTGRTLTVTGRRMWPAEFVTGQPPVLDDSGDRPLWFTVSQFDIMSDPA